MDLSIVLEFVDGYGEHDNCYIFACEQEMSNMSMILIHQMKVETGDLMKWKNKVVQELAGEFNQKHLSLGLLKFIEASNRTIDFFGEITSHLQIGF